MRTLTLILLGTLTLTSIALTRTTPPEAAEPALRPPIVCWMGSFSEVQNPRGELVIDPDRWLAVWREHLGEGVEKTAHGFVVWPRVDFERYSVLCLFDGASTNSSGLEVQSTSAGDGFIRVTFVRNTFQTASRFGDGPDGGVATRSFGFAVIDRPGEPVVVEELVQSLKAEPPRPVERYRLAAPAPAPAALPAR